MGNGRLSPFGGFEPYLACIAFLAAVTGWEDASLERYRRAEAVRCCWGCGWGRLGLLFRPVTGSAAGWTIPPLRPLP